MRVNIIRIGNSQGIRIPKILLEQSRLGKDVELEVGDEKIVIRSASSPRQGWGKSSSYWWRAETTGWLMKGCMLRPSGTRMNGNGSQAF